MEAGTGVPLKARAAAVKDPGSERALAVDVLSVGQAKAVRWIKVHHALHCGAMEDAEALLCRTRVRFGACAVRNCKVVDDDAVPRVVMVVCAVRRVVHQVVVATEEPGHFWLREKAEIPRGVAHHGHARPHFQHSARHAEVQPDAPSPANGVRVD